MAPASLKIRPARAEDREVLIELFQGLNVYEEPFVGNRRLDRAGGEDSLIYAEGKVAASGGHRLVAEVNGRVVGHLFMTWERHGPRVREEVRQFGYIAELFVREEHRGKGVGYALLLEAERLTRERGLRRMVLGVLAGNKVAERAYERFGFRPYMSDLIKWIGGSPAAPPRLVQGLVLRPAREDERAGMAEMSRALTLHEAPIVGNRRLDGLVGEDALRSAERRIAENGGHKLVADLDGRVIGQVLLTWERHGACVREDLKDYGEVVELFVSEAHRGKGVGRTLLTEAERLTREKGFGHMLLGVVRGNTIAERAYERFGFTPYATDLAKAIGA